MRKYICIYVGNHKPTEEQLRELRNVFMCSEVITINPPPLSTNSIKSAEETVTIINEILSKISATNLYYLWVQFPQVDIKLAAVYAESKILKHFSSICQLPAPYDKLARIKAFILPMTERKVIEEKLENGQIKKTSIFEHKGFTTVL